MLSDPYVTKVQDAIWTVLFVSGPILLAAIVVGVIIGLLQALTQIQDQTLPQGVKLLVVFLLLLVFGPIFAREIQKQATTVLDEFPAITR